MSRISSAAFSLTIVGDLRAVPVNWAEGIAVRQGQSGRASVTATITGQSSPVQYIVVDRNAYLRVGGVWQKVVLGNYDPSLVLDANQGMASTLGRATDGHVESSEPVNGIPCYKVGATIPTDMLHLLSIVTPQETMPATLWIAKRGHQLLKAQGSLQLAGAERPTQITLVLSKLNEAMTIEPPPVP